jgi:hypothetical protein
VNEALPRPVVLSKGMPSTRPADVRAPEAEACAAPGLYSGRSIPGGELRRQAG